MSYSASPARLSVWASASHAGQCARHSSSAITDAARRRVPRPPRRRAGPPRRIARRRARVHELQNRCTQGVFGIHVGGHRDRGDARPGSGRPGSRACRPRAMHLLRQRQSGLSGRDVVHRRSPRFADFSMALRSSHCASCSSNEIDSPASTAGTRLPSLRTSASATSSMANACCGCVLGDAGVKKHLQQHISEFLAQLVGVAAVHRVEQLVGLLQQVAAQRVVRLLALPRARGAQLVHHAPPRRPAAHRAAAPGAAISLLPGGQAGLHRGMVGIRGQQHRRVVAGIGAGRAAGSDHGTLIGISSVYCTSPAEQFDRLDRDQRRAARVDQDDCHGAVACRSSADATSEVRYINF